MKSLSDNYRAAHGNTHETFADLIFCALVVLVLFVLALAIEVSQRVRADLKPPPEIEEVKAQDVAVMTPEEIEELSTRIRKQSEEIEALQAKMKQGKEKVRSQMAALSGEQRFTGAREPASIYIAYNYKTDRFNFIPSKLISHAATRLSGESTLEYNQRFMRELQGIASKANKSRSYSLKEATALYNAISQYNEVVGAGAGYELQQNQVNVSYGETTSKYIAGDQNTFIDREAVVVSETLKIYNNPGKTHDGMYPQMTCVIDPQRRSITVNEVKLSPNDLRVILISVGGRGLVLDFEGYEGKPPKWLYDQVLMPAGYVSKTPKLPKL